MQLREPLVLLRASAATAKSMSEPGVWNCRGIEVDFFGKSCGCVGCPFPIRETDQKACFGLAVEEEGLNPSIWREVRGSGTFVDLPAAWES